MKLYAQPVSYFGTQKTLEKKQPIPPQESSPNAEQTEMKFAWELLPENTRIFQQESEWVDSTMKETVKPKESKLRKWSRITGIIALLSTLAFIPGIRKFRPNTDSIKTASRVSTATTPLKDLTYKTLSKEQYEAVIAALMLKLKQDEIHFPDATMIIWKDGDYLISLAQKAGKSENHGLYGVFMHGVSNLKDPKVITYISQQNFLQAVVIDADSESGYIRSISNTIPINEFLNQLHSPEK
jgi:hypothetical protein